MYTHSCMYRHTHMYTRLMNFSASRVFRGQLYVHTQRAAVCTHSEGSCMYTHSRMYTHTSSRAWTLFSFFASKHFITGKNQKKIRRSTRQRNFSFFFNFTRELEPYSTLVVHFSHHKSVVHFSHHKSIKTYTPPLCQFFKS